MNSNPSTFHDRYREMQTEQLLNISVSGDLTGEAADALEAELVERGVTEADRRQAIEVNRELVTEREDHVRAFSRRIYRPLLFLGIAMLAVLLSLLFK